MRHGGWSLEQLIQEKRLFGRIFSQLSAFVIVENGNELQF
jgi:hypothetical protein